MPRYGTFKYGRIAKYGQYNLRGRGSGPIGPHVPYRIRLRLRDKSIGGYLMLNQDRIEVSGNPDRFRIRANSGAWACTQKEQVSGNIYNVRIRTIASDGSASLWVRGERGSIK